MEDVITLSSGSETDDSAVEFVAAFTDEVTAKLVGLLQDPRGALPGLKRHQTHCSTASDVINFTDRNGTEQDPRTMPRDDCLIKKASKKYLKSRKCSSGHSTVFPVDCGSLKPKKKKKKKKRKKHASEANHIPMLKLKQVPLLETKVLKWKICKYSFCASQNCNQENTSSTAPECISVRTAAAANVPEVEPSLNTSPPIESHSGQSQDTKKEYAGTELFTDKLSPRRSCTPCLDEIISEDDATDEHLMHKRKKEGSCRRELPYLSIPSPAFGSGTRQLEMDMVEYSQTLSPKHSSPYSPSSGVESHQTLDFTSMSHVSPVSQADGLESESNPSPVSQDALPDDTSVRLSKEGKDSDSPNYMCNSFPSSPPRSLFKDEDMDHVSETGSYSDDLENDPASFPWEDWDDGEGMSEDCHLDVDYRGASLEDRCFVCPVALGKIMNGSAHALDEDDDGPGAAEMLCRRSLSLVYSTIEEDYAEGTLQLLSDLLQPGFYPPKDITCHLVRGILLDPRCPQHMCVQAFNLLMRTQRHHKADKMTVPWDWELLISVVVSQDTAKKHRLEVVCMFLEYVVRTLEDDFQAKRAHSAPHHSVAKEILSCDLHFSRVRDVIKWLFAAIVKSTECGESIEAARERDQHTRMVLLFQRMLSMALEVDRSPVLSSFKLSDELFHVLLSSGASRTHRMLLLESLESKLLRCKLLEHLLEHACPLKTSLPMSLSLLLHFLKNCTLTPDPTDGPERWLRWEELVHLLWMLLLCYSKAMNGLRSSATDHKSRVGTLVHRPHDVLSRRAVREAVEAFLSRCQADLGQDLPLHVHETLTYLQDYLLDACQC